MIGLKNGNCRIENNGNWWQSLKLGFTPTTGKTGKILGGVGLVSALSDFANDRSLKNGLKVLGNGALIFAKSTPIGFALNVGFVIFSEVYLNK